MEVEANSARTRPPVRGGVKPKPAHKPSELGVAGIPHAPVEKANVVGGENAGRSVLGAVNAVANCAVGAIHNNKGTNAAGRERTPEPKRAKARLKSVPDPLGIAETVGEVLVARAGRIVEGTVLRERMLRVLELKDPHGAVAVETDPVNSSLDPKPRIKHSRLGPND